MVIGKSRHNYIRRNLSDIKNQLHIHNHETVSSEISYNISDTTWIALLRAVAQQSINNSVNQLIPIA
jgi:hypothetical protein